MGAVFRIGVEVRGQSKINGNSVSFRPFKEEKGGERKEGRFSRLVTCADMMFADQTFAVRHLLTDISQYPIIKAL